MQSIGYWLGYWLGASLGLLWYAPLEMVAACTVGVYAWRRRARMREWARTHVRVKPAWRHSDTPLDPDQY